MPLFSYVAKTRQGQTKTEVAESFDEKTLIEKLQGENLFILDIIKITKDPNALVASKSRLSKKNSHDKVKLEDLLSLARQLAMLLQSGVPLLQSLNIVAAQMQSQRLSKALVQVRDDVQQGKSLSQSLARHDKIFNRFWISLVEVGEASGTMPLILNKLAGHLEQQAAFRSALISAMIYPMILMTVSVGAVIFFALVVAPKFQTIFESMHAELPFITRCLLGFFNFIRSNFLLTVGGLTGAFMLIKGWLQTVPGKIAKENFIEGLPVAGEVMNMTLTERFASQMAIMVEAGVPILYAMEIVASMLENRKASEVVTRAREGVKNGKSLAESLGQHIFFPDMLVQMVNVGEKTGELGKMLAHIGEFYQGKVQEIVKRLSTIIEPFMLLFLAFTIGIVVISFFLPLFELGKGGVH